MDINFHIGKDLGWAQITHPFHPLRGQRFRILKIKKSPPKDDIFLLENSNQTWQFIPREWTDKAATSSSSGYYFLRLLEVVEEIKAVNGEID